MNARSVRAPVLIALFSAAFLLGMFVDSFVRVMWVEDQVGPENSDIVDIVNSDPTSLWVLRLILLVTLAGSTIVAIVGSRRTSRGVAAR